MHTLSSLLISAFLLQVQAQAVAIEVTIADVSGEVLIRRGVEESWQPASAGTRLEEIDTILTGETGKVALKVADGETFELGSNAVLDIADLRRISERELFLFLISKKINRLGPRDGKSRLRIGRVNVVHGEMKADSTKATRDDSTMLDWVREKNGAHALYSHDYTTNAIMKLNKILLKYPEVPDCGELHFYLGRAFERLEKPGQAASAYRQVHNRSLSASCEGENAWIREAAIALQRLNKK